MKNNCFVFSNQKVLRIVHNFHLVTLLERHVAKLGALVAVEGNDYLPTDGGPLRGLLRVPGLEVG
jgi:hypothetical protein